MIKFVTETLIIVILTTTTAGGDDDDAFVWVAAECRLPAEACSPP